MAKTTSLPEFSSLEHMGSFSQLASQFPEMIIPSVRLFHALRRDELRALSAALQVYVAKEGTVILKEGEPGNAMLLIIDGLVQVIKGDPRDGATLGILDNGKTVGEMSLIDNRPRSATCLALQDCIFAVLTRNDFERLTGERPALGVIMLKEIALMLSGRLRNTNEKVGDDFFQFADVQ